MFDQYSMEWLKCKMICDNYRLMYLLEKDPVKKEEISNKHSEFIKSLVELDNPKEDSL